ncbi:MAG: 50S ribosomal protein L17 [Candidatus Adiutrix intracellularis]|jgi:large subunit ribosomal protein L17|nr:50S ribosomal protein L17 [Candidatus Adiutrix intracellularis]
MRHRKANVKLGRTASHRDALLRNLVTSLFEHGRITTTLAKAKALRPLVDRLVNLAKGGKADLHAFRQAAAVITKKEVLGRCFEEAAGRFRDRTAGYTIMVKNGLRSGDAAPLAILELIKTGQEKARIGGGVIPLAKSGRSLAGDRARRVAQSVKKAAAEVSTSEAPGVNESTKEDT